MRISPSSQISKRGDHATEPFAYRACIGQPNRQRFFKERMSSSRKVRTYNTALDGVKNLPRGVSKFPQVLKQMANSNPLKIGAVVASSRYRFAKALGYYMLS